MDSNNKMSVVCVNLGFNTDDENPANHSNQEPTQDSQGPTENIINGVRKMSTKRKEIVKQLTPDDIEIRPKDEGKVTGSMARFFQQLKTLLWRNILLKSRQKGQVCQELLFPVFFVALLALIKALVVPDTLPTRTFTAYDVNSTDFGQPFTARTHLYAWPNSTQHEQWMQDIVSQLNGPPQYRMFDSEDEAEKAYMKNHKHVKFGIIFNYDGDHNSYSIRTAFEKIPSSKDIYDFQDGICRIKVNATSSHNCDVNQYLTSGFVQLQLAIDKVLMTNLGVPEAVLSSRQTRVQMMDLPEYAPDTSYIQTISSIYFVFSFCILASYVVINVVTEKETKIKDGMLMMGLNPNVFWLSWSIIYMGMVVVSSLIMILIIISTSFFTQSSMVLLFLIFLLYGASFISLGFMLTPFFNKSRVAGAAAGLSTVFISLLYLIVTETRDKGSIDSNLPVWAQWLMCLLSPLAFANCMDEAIYLDLNRKGFGFDDSLTYGKFPLYAPISMLLVDTILYALLTVYFDHVVPGEYGVSYKPYFFLQPSYWFSSKREVETEQLVTTTNRTLQQSDDIEAVSASMESRLAMKISSISKSFKTKHNYAVDDFSLDIYEGHITCLLGHNGAGKTTLMNILTGVIPPTSGTASIMGRDITKAKEMALIRQGCGICPQHNILYERLSCKEHLRIFADIKGIPPSQRESKVLQALADADLDNQGDTFAKNLSGGQKRKLSVAIALIGDPKLIFLDEPTAGMDPYSRRHLWSLLKKKKEGRVVLLTTHFMDEADILSDRKVFLQRGKLRCCGSSLFLKKKFGIGYHVTMVTEPTCNVNEVTAFLTSIIPAVMYQRSHGKELAYTVPLSDLSNFAVLFGQLDVKSSELGIKSYGVSMTTLEEVFLKLEGFDEIDEEDMGDEKVKGNPYMENDDKSKILELDDSDVEVTNGHCQKNINTSKVDISAGFSYNQVIDKKDLPMQQFLTLLWIRSLNVLRNKKALFFQIVVPVILVVAGLIVIKIQDTNTIPNPQDLPIYLSYYANSSMASGSSPMPLPGLLAIDLLNTNESQALMYGWQQQYTVDTYDSKSANASPHFVGLQLNGMTGPFLTDIVALYNHTALHSIPAVVSLVTQTMLLQSNISTMLNVSTYPWPKTENKLEYDLNTMTAGMLIGLAFVLIIPGFSAEVVRDRESKIRGQLRISGVGFNIYWGTIYLVNFAIYLIPTLLIVILTMVIEIPGLNSGGAIAALLLLFLSNIPFFCFFAIILSFLFKKADSCTAYLPFLLNVAAILPYIAVSVIDMVDNPDNAVYIHYLFCIIDPAYIVMGGFYFIARINLFASYSGKEIHHSTYFDQDNHTLIAICMPFVHMIWMYWLLRVLDIVVTGGRVKEAFPCFSKSSNEMTVANTDVIEDEDSDVKAERSRIDGMESHGSIEKYTPSIDMTEMGVKVPAAYTRQLRKTFVKRVEENMCSKSGQEKTKVAVRNLSLGINEGEVLGLLGPNGAGKTTALNMVIAEIEPTCGNVVVGKDDVRSSVLNMAFLGYCPQHDALWDGITLREHIICFAAVKGVPRKEAEKLVDFYVSNMKLEDHKLKQAKKLSGGTKRKLSYILSILGNPDLVLMDEPSTGMDPQSKRFLWDTISSTFRNTNKGAILTTHYMEEADALCSRVGIMVNGQLQCLGSTQHLKDKFGSGYILEVKLVCREFNEIEQSMNKLESHLKELFPDMKRVERFMERAQYAIPKENVKSLGATFSSLEDCKISHQLEEYNFSQSSLEQVFLHFAKKQMNEAEEDQEDESTMRETSPLSPGTE